MKKRLFVACIFALLIATIVPSLSLASTTSTVKVYVNPSFPGPTAKDKNPLDIRVILDCYAAYKVGGVAGSLTAKPKECSTQYYSYKLNYTTSTATANNGYRIYSTGKITRSDDKLGLAKWAIRVNKTDSTSYRQLSGIKLDGDPVFTLDLAGFTPGLPKKSEIQGTLAVAGGDAGYLTIDGKLQISGNTNVTWQTPKKIGTDYLCSYYGTYSDPTGITCAKVGTDLKDNATNPAVTPPAADPSVNAGTNNGNSQSTPTGGPATVDVPGGKIEIASPTNTNCPDNRTTYDKGLLAGLSCDKAIKDINDVVTLIKNIVMNFLLPMVGTLFIIMIITGGIVYITSAGNQTRTDRAKKILTGAVIGLVITILAYTIISIFINILGGSTSGTTF